MPATVAVTLVEVPDEAPESRPISLTGPASPRVDDALATATPAPVRHTPIDAPVDELPTSQVVADATDPDAVPVVPRFDGDPAHSDDTDMADVPTSDPSWASGDAAAPGSARDGAGVRAWLARHKRYPRAALQRGIEGEVTLDLVLDEAGRVHSASIAQSSGQRLLDDEVTRMVARAQPFPSTRSVGLVGYRIVIEFHLEEQ
jgi:protein TonB